VGLPIRVVGDDGDPSKRYVRCPECGRTHNLLEHGITPRDLVPFEQRIARADLAQIETADRWKGR
jgi:hypothetical protein